MGALRKAAWAARRLVLFRAVVDGSPLLCALRELLQELTAPGPGAGQGEELWLRASALARQILGDTERGEAAGEPLAGAPSPWFDLLVERLLMDENPLTRALAGDAAESEMAPALLAAAAHDLRCLQALATLSGSSVETALRAREPNWPAGLLAGDGRSPATDPGARPWPEGRLRLARLLARCPDWATALPELAAYWRAVGVGLVGRYSAFRWEASGEGAEAGLVPVIHPDPTRLEDLVGYEEARQAVVENTERLVTGRPAHHLLLYGPRGTGKSATVRALIHTFAVRGLRLVELPLSRIGELPRLLGLLRREPQRFVIFLDDLSLESGDPAARSLKVVLEGALESWPENVRLYATSNRRHLVREIRNGHHTSFRPQDDVHEQISLADRFGVTVLFQAADQELYLRIVEGLLRRQGVRILAGGSEAAPPSGPGAARGVGAVDRQALAREALQWALWNNERSPRTAAQFVREWLGRFSGSAVDPP